MLMWVSRFTRSMDQVFSDHQLPGFDDGCGVAVRPLARLGQHGEQNFALDPLSYLKICLRFARPRCSARCRCWCSRNRARPNAAFASETLDDDLSERRHPRRGVQAGSAPGADDVQVFFIRVLDFFAAVAAGPIAADGRTVQTTFSSLSTHLMLVWESRANIAKVQLCSTRQVA